MLTESIRRALPIPSHLVPCGFRPYRAAKYYVKEEDGVNRRPQYATARSLGS